MTSSGVPNTKAPGHKDAKKKGKSRSLGPPRFHLFLFVSSCLAFVLKQVLFLSGPRGFADSYEHYAVGRNPGRERILEFAEVFAAPQIANRLLTAGAEG